MTSRKDAARSRLAARGGSADAELVSRTLKAVSSAVEQRAPLPEDQASAEVSAELHRMRADKRARDFATARGRH